MVVEDTISRPRMMRRMGARMSTNNHIRSRLRCRNCCDSHITTTTNTTITIKTTTINTVTVIVTAVVPATTATTATIANTATTVTTGC